MWRVYALLSALFAALTTILAKIGIKDVNSHLATALRTVVVLFMAWGMVFITGAAGRRDGHWQKELAVHHPVGAGDGRVLAVLLPRAPARRASRVAPIDKLSVVLTMVLAFVCLGEPPTLKTIIGGLLIAAGTLVIAIG